LGIALTFRHLIKNHGLSGLIAFVKIKTGRTSGIQLTGIENKITLRPNSSDVTTFKHIFAHDDYNYTLDQEPKIIIDAGANIGLASIYFTNKYSSARIIAIELSPSNFQVLAKNTDLYKNIEAINAGLWPTNQTLKFKEEGFSPWGYKVNNKLEGNSISIDSITIPDIIEKFNLNIIDLLKIDIEGAEVELFSENYETWLPKVKYIMVEFHDRWRSESSSTVRHALGKFNFKDLGMVGENVVFINDSL
jgi:FkbM family methyltransferase